VTIKYDDDDDGVLADEPVAVTNERRRHRLREIPSRRRKAHHHASNVTRRGRRISSKHGRTSIPVTIRLLRSQRHHRSRHRHRRHREAVGGVDLGQAAMTADVVQDDRRRPSDLKRLSHDVSESSRHRKPSPARQSVSGLVSSTIPPSSGDTEVKTTYVPLIHYYRVRRAGDADKQAQRRVLDRLLDASMSESERTARNLTSAVLDRLLGAAAGTACNRLYFNFALPSELLCKVFTQIERSLWVICFPFILQFNLFLVDHVAT